MICVVNGLRGSEIFGHHLTTEELLQKAACIEDVTVVQNRPIHANVLRQNRNFMASPEKVSEENEDDEGPRFEAPRVLNSTGMPKPGTDHMSRLSCISVHHLLTAVYPTKATLPGTLLRTALSLTTAPYQARCEMYVTSSDILQYFKAEHGVRCWICGDCFMNTKDLASCIVETVEEWTAQMNSLHHDVCAEIQSVALPELDHMVMLPLASCPSCGYSNLYPSTTLDERIV